MFSLAPKRLLGQLFVCILILTICSCSSDDSTPVIPDPEMAVDDLEEESEETSTDDSANTDEEPSDVTDTNNDPTTGTCTEPSNFIFNESNGLLSVEFEKGSFSGSWTLKNDGDSHTGDGYMVWEGSQYFNQPGNGMGIFKIKIENGGVYRFIWSSAVTTGTNGTEHNDTWLRFNDANDFYAKKGNEIIYPSGTGKSPNPEGASKEGWFKIYRSGNDLDFKWQARTSDNDAHEIYVKFDNPGLYTMEISARSSGHAIDKFVLFNTNVSESDAISMEQSSITCD